jgi:tungstate transport system substrate-binding protein
VRIRAAAAAAVFLVVMLAAGCGGSKYSESQRKPLVLATTTSAQDSGILDEFVKQFEHDFPYSVKAVAVGSGAALFMGRNGDADVMMTHEPKAEAEFMSSGIGETNDKVMHNDFIVVGPADDPAGIKGLKDADEAFRRIAEGGSEFVSRADASGTNAMEMSVWERIGAMPQAGNYIETGQGMGETMRIANEKGAYTLCDRATFIVMEEFLDLEKLVEGDDRLINQYTVTVVNPEKFPRINHDGAVEFRDFVLSKKTKEFIEDYGWDRYRQHLFYPD